MVNIIHYSMRYITIYNTHCSGYVSCFPDITPVIYGVRLLQRLQYYYYIYAAAQSVVVVVFVTAAAATTDAFSGNSFPSQCVFTTGRCAARRRSFCRPKPIGACGGGGGVSVGRPRRSLIRSYSRTRCVCVCASSMGNGCRTSVVYIFITYIFVSGRGCVCSIRCIYIYIYIPTPVPIHKLYVWWEQTLHILYYGTLCNSPCDHHNIVISLYCCNNDECLI